MKMMRSETGGGRFAKGAARRQIVDDTTANVSTRKGIIANVEDAMEVHVEQIKQLYPDAQIGFRGSLARGTKGPHKQNAPFDPRNFDVDAFIVSDELAASLPKPRGGWKSGNQVEELRNIQREIDTILKKDLPGLRKGEDFTFRIWSREQFEREVGADERHFIK